MMAIAGGLQLVGLSCWGWVVFHLQPIPLWAWLGALCQATFLAIIISNIANNHKNHQGKAR